MDSIYCSKYLALRLKLNKRIETINGMKLSLDRFSGHYPDFEIATGAGKNNFEKKHWIVCSPWFAARGIWALDNPKHVFRLADMLCFPFFRHLKYNFIGLFFRGRCVGSNDWIINDWLWPNFSYDFASGSEIFDLKININGFICRIQMTTKGVKR